MAEVFLSPDIALRQYEELRQHRRHLRVLQQVDELLDALEVDPGQSRLRVIRFQDPPLWCITFVAAGAPWAILWNYDGADRGRVLVDYIGPASFA